METAVEIGDVAGGHDAAADADSRVCTRVCANRVNLIVQRASVHEEPLARLARIAFCETEPAKPDTAWGYTMDFARSKKTIGTADEIARLCYWVRGTREAGKSTQSEEDWIGTVSLDIAYVAQLPWRFWEVATIGVVDKIGNEYACWTNAELAETLAEWRACARAAPVDAAEAPPRDSEI